MNKREAREILERRVADLRLVPYDELLRFLDKPEVAEVVAESGRLYGIEIEAFWDDRRGGNLRLVVAIDDGGWSAFSPMTADFIKSPEGGFVGE